MRGEEQAADLKRSRCLACAADREIAEANHRHTGGPSRRAHPERCRNSVDAGERAEPPAAAIRVPPEGRFAHQGLILTTGNG